MDWDKEWTQRLVSRGNSFNPEEEQMALSVFAYIDPRILSWYRDFTVYNF